jgi:IS30 family transposase
VGSSRIKYNCCREKRDVEAAINTRFYCANPYHSRERGASENTNGLIRQYIPKGSCMKDLTQAECDRIAKKLNTRPRKRHGFKTTEEILYG